MKPTLTVWSFSTADGAENAVSRVQELVKQELIKVHDGAVVTWPSDAKKPKTQQFFNTTAAGAANGGFWGLLFGILFFVPLLGAAFGAAMGALNGSLVDIGINDSFIDDVRSKVQPGTSALFLMASDAVLDKVADATSDLGAHLLQTNLSKADEEDLRALFAD